MSTGSPKKFQFTFPILFVIILLAFLIMIISFCLLKWICRLCRTSWKYEEISDGTDSDFILSIDRGPSGLRNNHESCYMNSMIQALASSEILIKEYDELLDKYKNTILRMFRDLLKGINAPYDRRDCIDHNTMRLKKLVTRSQWKAVSQQDAFHLLSAVIIAIQKDFQDVQLETEKMSLPPMIKLLHTFTESIEFNKVQNHLALAVPLCGDFRDPHRGVKLSELLDAYFSPSSIDDGPNITRMFLYEKVPRVLIIHIQANEWNSQGDGYLKPAYYIKFDETMTYTFEVQIKPDCTEMKRMGVKYQLRAVVHHMGTVDGGHYITYRMHHGEWYLTNDTQVDKTVFRNDIIPYIMVYEKISEDEL